MIDDVNSDYTVDEQTMASITPQTIVIMQSNNEWYEPMRLEYRLENNWDMSYMNNYDILVWRVWYTRSDEGLECDHLSTNSDGWR